MLPLGVLVAGIAATSAHATFVVPGWRDPYGSPPALDTKVDAEGDRVVHLAASADAPAGIDQFIESPPGRFSLLVAGKGPGPALVSLEWSRSGEVISRRDARVDLTSGHDKLEVRPPAGQPLLRVLVVDQKDGGYVDLDSVSVRQDGVELLTNPGLNAKCQPDQTPAEWRSRYAGARVHEVGSDSTSAPVAIESARSLAGLDQFMPAPSSPVIVRVEGRPPRGRAQIAMEWSNKERVLKQDKRELHLKGGVQTERFLAVSRAQTLSVQVIQRTPGTPLVLDGVDVKSAGRQIARNPKLDIEHCGTRTASAASEAATSGRGIAAVAGGLALVIVGAALVYTRRRSHR